jgi:hypothetical protein
MPIEVKTFASQADESKDMPNARMEAVNVLGQRIMKLTLAPDWKPTLTTMMQSDALAFHNQRCFYENNEIMVEHSLMTFPDGTSEAVMVVNLLKDGKIIRTETGATPIT